MRYVWCASCAVGALSLGAGAFGAVGEARGADPWADTVVSYDEGSGVSPELTDPETALGSPERFTGEDTPFPSVVSPFSPPFAGDEIVSIGEGGQLTLAFDEPIADDPSNPFGADLIVFGNGGFVDVDFPNGRVGSPPVTFGLDQAQISVSADGMGFVPLGSFTEGFFPHLAFEDAGAFDEMPGRVPTSYTTPVDPSLTLDDFDGATLEEIRGLYAGSGGGTPIDIAGSGLPEVSFVRISVPDDGDPGTSLNAEIDAIATVPTPAGVAVFALAAGGLARRRR